MDGQNITKTGVSEGTVVTVAISGTLTIEAAAELRRVLGEALAEAPEVVLDAGRLEGLDLPILQAICSACKTAAATGRRLLAAGPLPGCVKRLNDGIGAHMASPCRHNNDHYCMWFGGTH